jgi:diacylglycerol O-acyltransferase
MDCVSKLQNLPMDMTKPLWDVHIVENYSRGWACLYRIHHCVGDGYSLESAFCSLSDNSFEELIDAIPKFDIPNQRDSLLKTVMSKMLMFIWFMTGLLSVTLKWVMAALIHDPKTVFKTGTLVAEKKLAWTHPNDMIDVEECKKVGRKYGATVNDVMISCFAGAMQRYMERELQSKSIEVETKKQSTWRNMFLVRVILSIINRIVAFTMGDHDGIVHIRAAMPINLRNPLHSIQLLKEHKIAQCSNNFGFITPMLPITGFKDPLERLLVVRDELKKGKSSVERIVSGMASLSLAICPRWIVRLIFQFLTTGITMAITNVRGYPAELRMHDTSLSRMLGFVPGPSSCEITALIISYNNKLNLCLNCNASTIPKPQLLVSDFVEEYKLLREAASQA